MKTISIDIETVLDEESALRCGYTASDEFAPFPLHRIVCASAFAVTGRVNGERLYALESYSQRDLTERGIIASLEKVITDANVVISYNGNHFDLPVLATRAMVHEVHVPNIVDLQTRSRVGRHMDLFERVKHAAAPVSLRQLCAPFAIPVKKAPAVRVDDLVAAGDWDALECYCETDAVACWLAAEFWNRVQDPGLARQSWRHFAGWITTHAYQHPTLAPFVTVPEPIRLSSQLSDLETITF